MIFPSFVSLICKMTLWPVATSSLKQVKQPCEPPAESKTLVLSKPRSSMHGHSQLSQQRGPQAQQAPKSRQKEGEIGVPPACCPEQQRGKQESSFLRHSTLREKDIHLCLQSPTPKTPPRIGDRLCRTLGPADVPPTSSLPACDAGPCVLCRLFLIVTAGKAPHSGLLSCSRACSLYKKPAAVDFTSDQATRHPFLLCGPGRVSCKHELPAAETAVRAAPPGLAAGEAALPASTPGTVCPQNQGALPACGSRAVSPRGDSSASPAKDQAEVRTLYKMPAGQRRFTNPKKPGSSNFSAHQDQKSVKTFLTKGKCTAVRRVAAYANLPCAPITPDLSTPLRW
ncbi:Ef-Hand Calcium-Binding Domain-Containing Protein 5 [Manis pentadactyla]|nr:Ef-Hand Calcium-Binding Domain-Containing Protein 5 [Manis pentadactyla]